MCQNCADILNINTSYKYTNIYIYIYIYISHPWSGDNQDQKLFLAPSADKQTHSYDYDTECSNQHHSQLP